MIQQNTPSNSLISVIQEISHSFIGGISNIIYIFIYSFILYSDSDIKPDTSFGWQLILPSSYSSSSLVTWDFMWNDLEIILKMKYI